MKLYEATEEEYLELWDCTAKFWDAIKNNSITTPWVEYKFRLGVFKTTLSQKCWKKPDGMR